MRNFVLAIAICFSLLVVDALAQRKSSRSGSLGMTQILQSLDTNRNGMLDANEANGRTKDFVRRAGLDPGKTHSIAAIAKALNGKNKNDKKAKANGKTAGGAPRKVPGFGVESTKMGVKDFSPSGEERMSVEAMNVKFGDSVMAQVERTMKRYDNDKNGMIDPVEQKRTRWTNPSADVSDMNKDGNLSRLELAYRYKQREDDAAKRKTSKSSSSRRASISSSRGKSTSSSTRGSSRFSRGTSPGRTSSSRSSSRGSRGTPNPAGNTNTAKRFDSTKSDAYRKYAEGLFKNYDKNKDGRLSKDELGEMRRPPKNADANKDGFVDKNELIASVTRKSGGSGGSASSSAGKASAALDSKRRSPKKTYNESDSVFGGRDANNDGQLQMSEYTEQWTQELVEEFRGKDINDDGVITAKEWNK